MNFASVSFELKIHKYFINPIQSEGAESIFKDFEHL